MDDKGITFVGPSCGHHAHYTFYKAIKYVKNGRTSILGLGEFFFVKIWPKSDLLAVGELQLLWEDKSTNQILSSLRLYFLPEYTPEGRLPSHGEDEVISVAEKTVLRVSDLLDWIANPKDVQWDRGIVGICHDDCEPSSAAAEDKTTTAVPTLANGLGSQHLHANNFEFMAEVRKEKQAIGDVSAVDDLAVIILSHSRYGRYRSVLQRVSGRETEWMLNSLIVTLGGFTTPTRRTHILFCKDSFDYAELEEHPFLCNHLAPKLKGRPRKRKKPPRAGSPESESASSESSVSTSVSIASGYKGVKNGLKRDLVEVLSQKNTKEELEFLRKLTVFMDKRNTPIERPPMLGFKQIDLHLFFEKVARLGGYDGCVLGKAWKSVYDELGGNPQNTSAATCTRRHYEKLLLPFELHLKELEKPQQQRSLCQSKSSDQETHPTKGASENPNQRPTVVAARAETSDDVELAAKEGETKSIACIDVEGGAKTGTSLTPVMSRMVERRKESQVRIDPEGKKLQIDDLIIIPNNVHGTGTGDSGSALQNLAKIASRYQGTRQESESESGERCSPKKPRVSSPKEKVSAPTNVIVEQLAAQQSLLGGGFSQGLLPAQSPVPGAKGQTSNSATMQLAAAMMGLPPLGDLSKLGPEGVRMLQMYEKHLTQMAASMAAISGNQLKNGGPDKKSPASSEQSHNLSGSVKSPLAAATKDGCCRDRNKVSKPPPETKRPPSLMQTACAFTQTSTIYANPLAELNKLRDESKFDGQQAAPPSVPVDLSSSSRHRKRAYASPSLSPHGKPAGGGGPPSGSGMINLKKESTLLKPGAIGSSGQPASHSSSSAAVAASLLSGMNVDLASSLKLDPVTLAALQSSPFASQLLSPYLGSSPSGMPLKSESKISPFSAEALLSKSSVTSKPTPAPPQNRAPLTPSPNTDYLKNSSTATPPLPKKHLPSEQQRYPSPSSDRDFVNSRRGSAASPAAATSSSSSAMFSMNLNHPVRGGGSSTITGSSASSYNPLAMTSNLAATAAAVADKGRGNHWHTPSTQHGSKPQDLKSKDSFQNALLGLAVPPGLVGSTCSTAGSSTFSSSMTSSLPSSTQSSMHQSLAAALAGLPPTTYAGLSSATINPYLALMGIPSVPASSKPTVQPAPPPNYGALMDPATSAYYAALYSQQMYGLSPYSGLGTSPSGVPSPQPPVMRQAPVVGSSASTIPGLDALQATALQAMMGTGGIRPLTGTAPSGSSASMGGGSHFGAGNPFAGLTGMPGFQGSFPPGSSRKD